jgi:hypothetical protein
VPDSATHPDPPRGEHTSAGILTLVHPDGSHTRHTVDLPHVAGSSPELVIGPALDSEGES